MNVTTLMYTCVERTVAVCWLVSLAVAQSADGLVSLLMGWSVC